MQRLYNEENVQSIADAIREQQGIEGYNLIQYYDLTKRKIAGVDTEISNNNIILNGTATSSTNAKISSLDFILKANTPYTFVSFVEKKSSSAQGAFLIGTDSVTNKISLPYQQEINVKNVTLTEDFNFNRLSLYMGGAGIVLDFTAQIMLLEGTYTTDNIPQYEPYLKMKLSEMPQAILDIPKGIDTSDATAVSDDIILGKTAYARGTQVVGTYEPSGGKTYTGHVDVEGLKQIGWTDEDIQYLQDNVWWNEEDDNLYKLSDEEKSGVVNQYKTRFLPKNSGINKFNEYSALNTIPKIAVSTSIASMFSYCYSLQKIPELDTGNVTSMGSMFNYCCALQEIPELDTGNVTSMGSMFQSCYSLQKIPELDTGNVANMSSMFQSCYSLQEIPELDTGNVTNMSSMFYGCSALQEIPELDTGNVTNMSSMFYGCSALQKIPELDTGNVTSMGNMFQNCYALQEIPELDTGNVTSMGNMFQNCYALQEIPKLDTGNVTTMASMLYYCRSLQEIPELDTGNVTTMASMCYGCSALQKIPKLDTSSVTYMNGTFTICSNLIDLGGFQNLGKAYLTTQSANYSTYTLTLSVSTKITHDSLINVINNLYDIATKGCKSQRLILGATNLKKLTDEEKAIATTKGWTLS